MRARLAKPKLERGRNYWRNTSDSAVAQDTALADKLQKSVRTVNNQLATLYRKKLGLSGDQWRLLQAFEQDLTQARYFLQHHILTM